MKGQDTSVLFKHLDKLAMLAIFALALWGGAIAIVDGFKLAAFPYETSGPETFILHGATQWAQGQALYPTTGAEPFIYNVYNPLTYVPVALGHGVLSLNLTGSLWFGRAASMLALTVLLALLGRWVAQRTGSWRWGLLLVALLLCWEMLTLSDFFRARPEIPGLLATWLGIFLLCSSARSKPKLAALAFFFAFAFKQSFIIAPVAAVLMLLAGGQWRVLGLFVGTYGAILGGFFLLMWSLMGHTFFEHTLFAMGSNEITFGRWHSFLWSTYLSLFWAPLLGALWSLWALHGELRNTPIIRFLLAYICVLTPWVFYSSAKDGAHLNYFLELSVAVLVLFVYALGTGAGAPRIRPIVLLLLAAGVLQVAVFSPRLAERVQTEDLTARIEALQGAAGPMLITLESLAVHTGEVRGLDWVLLDLLQQKDRIDITPLTQDIQQGRFTRVILDQRPWTGPKDIWLDALAIGPYVQVSQDALSTEWLRRDLQERPASQTTGVTADE